MATTKQVKEDIKKQKEDYLNERVPITLHRPESEKKDFRTVSVNGVNYQIEFQKQVMVPRFVAEVIHESDKNEQIAKNNADEKAQDFLLGKSSLEG